MNWKKAKDRIFWWGVGVFTGLGLTADIAFGRSIDSSKAGVSLWVFLCVGAFIILLQLVPAIILFLGFLTSVHKAIRVKKEVKSEVLELEEE